MIILDSFLKKSILLNKVSKTFTSLTVISIMKSNKTFYQFRVSGNYPNQRNILCEMETYLQNHSTCSMRGSIPPVLELLDEKKNCIRELKIRTLDIPFLLQKDLKKAETYVTKLLQANDGDSKARKLLDKHIQNYFTERKNLIQQIPTRSGKNIIPCTSTKEYSENQISNKGAILLNLNAQGYPVPDFVIMTSDAYHIDKKQRIRCIEEAIHDLENLTFQKIGSGEDPLIFAIRSAMPYYLPGVMPTYLNVGVTDQAYSALIDLYGKKAAQRMYLNNLWNILEALDRDSSYSNPMLSEWDEKKLDHLLNQARDAVQKKNPSLLEDPIKQAVFFTRQAYHFFRNNLDLMLNFSKGKDLFPSMIFQKMICTVRNPESQVGVLFSRHPRTGEGMQMESGFNIFGEEIMAGNVEPQIRHFFNPDEIRDHAPGVHHFIPSLQKLEKDAESPITIEFATDVNDRHNFFALLQLNKSQLTGRSAFISVMDMHQQGIIEDIKVPELIQPCHVKQIESDAIDPQSLKDLKRFCTGTAILPRTAVTAQLYFSKEAALQNKKAGKKVCFCKQTFKPNDTVVMSEMDAIISLASAAIHVVTICQSYGLPALLNLEKEGVRLTYDGRLISESGEVIREGDWITISSRNHALYIGKAQFTPARLVRYMQGEKVELEPEEEKAFEAMSQAYQAYNRLMADLKNDVKISLTEIIRLVVMEFRGETEKAGNLVNDWFDRNHEIYVEEIFKCEMGDHSNQHTVFNLLTLDRKIKFFKHALQKCNEEKRTGYTAGAFMLGRFICLRQPLAFWESFTPMEIAILLNEWILFEKYLDVLNEVGERKLRRVKRKIMSDSLGSLQVTKNRVKIFITLKLSKISLTDVRKNIPKWCDPQTQEAVALLSRSYSKFYNYENTWSIAELTKICKEENVSVPDEDAH